MPYIDFSKVGELLQSSADFSLTEKQYKNLTGHKMPKSSAYLMNKSALSKYVGKLGFEVQVREKEITFKRKEAEEPLL